MPTPQEIIADESLRSQCVWLFLEYLPSETFLVEDLAQFECEIPRIPFTGDVLASVEWPGYVVLRQRCILGPLPEPSTGTVRGFAILFPGDPDGLIGVGELPGGYPMGSGDALEFLLTVLVPAP